MCTNKPSILTIKPKTRHTLTAWRGHQGSLTDKLLAIKETTDLTIITQGWARPNWWDQHLVHITDPLAFQRIIIMKSKGVAYWYARTIIPQKCYFINPHLFKRLEQESIKNLLFNDSRVERISLIDYPVNHQCIEFNWVKEYLNERKIPEILWVRLAEYSLEQLESFYLVEILLPELESL